MMKKMIITVEMSRRSEMSEKMRLRYVEGS